MEKIIDQARLIAEKYLATSPILKETQIQILASSSHGFSFSLRFEGSENILEFGQWHQPFDNDDEALTVFEKCLSGEARLRNIMCLGVPYSGILEIWDESLQKFETKYMHGTIAVLFLFLLPKKETIYQNAFVRVT